MVSTATKKAFLLDLIKHRREQIADILKRYFGIDVDIYYADTTVLPSQLFKDIKKWKDFTIYGQIFVSEIRETMIKDTVEEFHKLNNNAKIFVIVSSNRNDVLPPYAQYINVDIDLLDEEKLVTQIEGSITLLPRHPELCEKYKNSIVLREQVRSLGGTGRLADGEDILSCVVQNFFKNVKVFEIEPISQGLSEASIFKLLVPDECVLKMTKMSDYHKVKNELDNWTEIESFLTTKDPRGEIYDRFVPTLIPPECNNDIPNDRRFVDGRNNWRGVAYGFLGGTLGDIKTLKELYIDNKIDDSITIDAILRVFSLLRERFYDRSEVRKEPLWEFYEQNQKVPISSPPFLLSGRQKVNILSALSGELGDLASYYFKINRTVINKLNDIIEKELNSFFGGNTDVLCSPVHGDLNSSNIMIKLRDGNIDKPYLIDFACYHKGIMLQDFAKLEVEIKILLMDKERKSGIKSLDYDIHRLGKWIEMEDCIHGDAPYSPKKRDKGMGGIIKAFNHICCIRKMALATYDKCCKNQDEETYKKLKKGFKRHYSASLFYHTVRMIGYSNIPMPKRLLAVYDILKILKL